MCDATMKLPTHISAKMRSWAGDERGSVRTVLRVDSGTPVVAQQITYDPWGVPTFVFGGETVQPVGYAGAIWLSHAGFWHMGARDYDPAIGRWTSKDPIRFGGGMNLYEYAGGDPVNYLDVDGEKVIGVGLFAGYAWIQGAWLSVGIYSGSVNQAEGAVESEGLAPPGAFPSFGSLGRRGCNGN